MHTAEHLRALLFGAPDERRPIDHALRKLRLYATPSGAVIGDEDIHGLPTPDGGYESCTLTELLFSLTSAAQKTGDATIGDWNRRGNAADLDGQRPASCRCDAGVECRGPEVGHVLEPRLTDGGEPRGHPEGAPDRAGREACPIRLVAGPRDPKRGEHERAESERAAPRGARA